MKQYYIYIISNNSGTMYIGVTNNLFRRIFEHKNKIIDGFTKKYNINRLIYFEQFQDVYQAIIREKQIKSWRREKKINLIKTKNPKFEDLTKDWFDQNETLSQ